VGDYLKRLDVQKKMGRPSSSTTSIPTTTMEGGVTTTTTSSTTIQSHPPFNPMMHEVQSYLQAAQISYGIIMRLKDEGKIYYAALKHLM